MVNSLSFNPITVIRENKANGQISKKLAAQAEALVERVQKEVLETSSRVNAAGEYHIRPYWGTSAHQTSIKLDPSSPPTESEPLQGVREFSDSDQVYGKWGHDSSISYEADSKHMVFRKTDDSVRNFSVTLNANGTLTIDPGEKIPVYIPLD